MEPAILAVRREQVLVIATDLDRVPVVVLRLLHERVLPPVFLQVNVLDPALASNEQAVTVIGGHDDLVEAESVLLLQAGVDF